MDTDRNFGFLSSVDIKKYIINEPKKQIQNSPTIQFRSLIQKSQIEISFNHSFLSQTLITNVEILCMSRVIYQTNFQDVEIQVSSLSNRGHYSQLVNLKSGWQDDCIAFSGAGFTHCIKINLLLKLQAKRKYTRPSQKQFQQNIQKLISQCIKDINIYGVTINSNPNSILLTKLLNISQSFKKYNMFQQSAQTDILVALSLINARRFILAGQILRKVSKFYVQKYTSSKSTIDLNKTQRSIFKETQQQPGYLSTIKTNYGAGRIFQSNKFLHRAAKIQLLIAEAISHPSLVLQKMQAYHRCNSYSNGNINPIPLGPDADLQDVAITMLPQIINFFLKILYDKLQPIRIAALKSIQFFIQTLGCSIGSTYLQILKQVILTYPCGYSPEINTNRIPYGLQQILIQQKSTTQPIDVSISNIKNKILIDHYHHLLQTLLSLMTQINRRIIITIFSQIVLPSILQKNPSNQLKLYLLRFSQKCITISGADLNIEVHFIGLLLNFSEQKNVGKNFINNFSINKNNSKAQSNISSKLQNAGGSHNKHVIHNLVYFSHKILSVLKTKVLPRYSGNKMLSLLQWINKTLTYIGQNQLLSHSNSPQSFFLFTTILDFIIAIYSNLRYDSARLVISPIQTVLYFSNIAINNQQAGLPFEKILQALTVLLKYHSKMDRNFQLGQQIISRILQKSRQYNLSFKQLQILIEVLQINEQDGVIVLSWLQVYLGCIPHSTYDQTYKVFCILLEKSMKQMQNLVGKKQLLKKIVKTMLDQYTVKGKAHQQAKQALIHNLIKNKSSCFLDLMQICLFNNLIPQPDNYNSKKKFKTLQKNKKDIQHRYDSKGYKIDYEMFLQKISMAQLILTTISTLKYVPQTLLENKFIQNFFNYMKNLIQSSNTKLKNKSISLINHYLQIIAIIWKKEDFNLVISSTIIRNVFNITRIIIPKIKQSKLMYSVIFNIVQLCRFFDIQTEEIQNLQTQQNYVQKIYEYTELLLKNQTLLNDYNKNTKKIIAQMIIFKQFFKLWTSIGQAMCSPWQNIRQIYILLILQIFKEGLNSIPVSMKKKVIDFCKPLMTSLFKSNEHNERQSALKIFGCLVGLRRTIQNKDNKFNYVIFQNIKYLKEFIEKVHNSIYDWDQKTIQIAQNLCEICLTQQSIQALNQKRKQIYSRKSNFDLENSYLSFNLEQQINLQKKNQIMFGITNNLDNPQMRQSWLVDQELLPLQELPQPCPVITEQIMYKITQFRNLINKQIQAKTQIFSEKQSFMEQNQQQFYDMGEQKAQSIEAKEKSQDDQLEFQDLGIIELDDQQWGQQEEKSQKAIQKLSIKKTYKLSPSVLNSSKPQRIRSKRFHQNQFDFREKIIVDQLQQKIANPNQIQNIKNLQPRSIGTSNKNYYDIPNSHQPLNVLEDKEKDPVLYSKQSKDDKILKNQQFYKYSPRQPLIIDDYYQEQDLKVQEMVPLQIRPKKQKQQKIQKKQAFQKQLHIPLSNKEKQTDKKTKKSSARKRKPSIGK